MKYLLLVLMLTSCAHAQPAPTPSAAPAEKVKDPIVVMGAAQAVLSVQPNGDILLKGKVIGNDPEAYTALSGGIANLQGQVKACMDELAKAPKPAPVSPKKSK